MNTNSTTKIRTIKEKKKSHQNYGDQLRTWDRHCKLIGGRWNKACDERTLAGKGEKKYKGKMKEKML